MRANGFTYLGLLFALALAAAGFAVAGVVWHIAGKRAKEQQLLFAGSAIRDAIQHYYLRSPGGIGEYPRALEDLVEDRRYVTVERHLRKLYVDPITGKPDWELITGADGRIVGVYSPSRDTPLKRENFRGAFASFARAGHYSDWRFSVVDEQAALAPAQGATADAAAVKAPPGERRKDATKQK